MARFLCPCCEEVVDAGAARFAFCVTCGAPLTTENMLPIQLIRGGRDQPDEEALAEPTAS
jgi:hypothetical protein